MAYLTLFLPKISGKFTEKIRQAGWAKFPTFTENLFWGLPLGQIQNKFIRLHYYLYQFERLPTAHCLNRIKLQPQLLTGQGGVSGLNAQHLADLGPKSGLEHAVNQLLEETSSALESRLSSKIVYRLSV